MDSSNRNDHSQTSNQNPLQFTIHLPHSSFPNPFPTENPNSNPDLVQSSDSNAISGQNHFLSAPVPKGKRRGRPRNPPSSSPNQVKGLSFLPNSSSSRNAGVPAGISGLRQAEKLHMENPSTLTLKKHGSSSNSGVSAKRSAGDLSDEIIVINKDATAEALIALTSGFPADSLTEEEIDFGVVSDVGGIEQVNYILIRNHIIARWRENVKRWVKKEMFVDVVPKHCGALLDSAYNYLVAHGYINFGVAPEIRQRLLTEPSKPKVIVIGAGLAGLAAARQLMAFGFKVVVLEGRKRAGGRVYTTKLQGGSDGKKVGFADLGGSVLTGTLGNPLGILARQLSFKLHKIRDKCPLYKMNGAPVDPELDHKVEVAFNELLDTVSKHRKMMGEVSQDVSLGSALETFGGPFNAEERNLFDWHLANLEYANAELLSRLSLAFWDQDDPYDMGGDHCFLHGGNGKLIDALVEDVQIVYEKIVEEIRYGNNGVQVTAGNQVYMGDMVLCTVPLGVLKSDSIKFIPELPQRKLDGIKRLGFGLLNKVVMLFSHAFWGTDLDTFGHLSDDPSNRGEFFLFYSYATVAGGAILIGLVAGEAAYRFELIGASAATERAVEVLRAIYGPKGIDVPNPVQSACTRWGGDPLSCGSYSNVAVGASGDDYDILAESVGDGRLFFAGEATNRRYPATMHGALLSGFREAANIAHHAKVRSAGLKVEKNPSINAHDCATILTDLFRTPDVEFGSFAVIYGRKKSDSMAILRVTFDGQRKKPDQRYSNKLLFEQLQSHFNQQREFHVYELISKQQALELREVRGGDEARLNYLCEKIGVKLVGRKGLGPAADSVIASIKAARSQGRHNLRKDSAASAGQKSESKPKAPAGKQKLIRRAQILRNGNRSSIHGPNAGSEVSSSNVKVRIVGPTVIDLARQSQDIEIRVPSSNSDATPPISNNDDKLVTDPHNTGQDLSVTPLESDFGASYSSSNSVLASLDSNVGMMLGDPSSNSVAIMDDISGSSTQNLCHGFSTRPLGSISQKPGHDFAVTPLGSNFGPSYSSPPDSNVMGNLGNSDSPNFAPESSSTPLSSNDVASVLQINNCLPSQSVHISAELAQIDSIAPPDSSLAPSHISSIHNTQNYAGDISDSLNSISIQENIFDDIMNELLPDSGTNPDTWHFSGNL